MESFLVYLSYAVAAIGSFAVYSALPRDGAAPRKSFLIPMLGLTIGGVIVLMDKFTGAAAKEWYAVLLVVLSLGGAVRVVTHPKPVYSALYFVMVVLSTAALMVVCGAEFLGAALVVVYAGAILVTYVFVIMLAQQSHLGTDAQFSMTVDYDRSSREPFAAVAAGFVLVATVAGVIAGRGAGAANPVPPPVEGNTMAIGRVLLTDFAISVELAGVLLMVAMIGAIAIARKRFPKHEEGAPYQPGEIGRHVKPF